MRRSMKRASYHGVTIAESIDTHEVDGYTYFPRAAVKMEHLEDSEFTTRCPAKGSARYWHVSAGGGKKKLNAAFSYEQVSSELARIEGWVGFYADEGEDSVHVA